jgi:hypothetical protein
MFEILQQCINYPLFLLVCRLQVQPPMALPCLCSNKEEPYLQEGMLVDLVSAALGATLPARLLSAYFVPLLLILSCGLPFMVITSEARAGAAAQHALTSIFCVQCDLPAEEQIQVVNGTLPVSDTLNLSADVTDMDCPLQQAVSSCPAISGGCAAARYQSRALSAAAQTATVTPTQCSRR